MIEYFQPGHAVYLQVEAAAPAALPMFTIWVAADQARHTANEQLNGVLEKIRDQPKRDDDLMLEWRNIGEVHSTLATASAMALNILAERLREARIDNPYGWAQERLSALKNEAASAQNAA